MIVINSPLILSINPGSTSTKIALFSSRDMLFKESISHPLDTLLGFEKVLDQFDYRKDMIRDVLNNKNIDTKNVSAVVGRGGLLRPLEGGTYRVNQKMLKDLESGQFGEHASDLGAMIAWHLAEPHGIPAYIVNPIVVDELEEVARISGMPEIPRKSIFHALNQKAVAINYAESQNKKYEEAIYIVAHLGGGISVGAHKNGRVIDVNNALYGEGPFSPERSGAVPARDLLKMAYSGQYTEAQLQRKIVGKGGLIAYLGTNDAREVNEMIKNGDPKGQLVFEALAYQVAKEIGAAATVLHGQMEAIIITGGLAFDQELIRMITERISWMTANAELVVVPGERELEALAQGALRVINGEESVKYY